jgi:hypothetical protein
MSSRENIESLKEKLYDSETKYYWEYQGSSVIGKHGHLINWVTSILFTYPILGFFWFVLDDLTIDSIAFWGLFAFITMMMLASRYLYLPDKHRCYHLTPLGIHYTEKDMIPDVAYQVVRGFAWVGIVVCVIAVFVLGPLAFVGAGGFALMSFGMTNFKPTTEKHEVFFSDRPILFNPMSDSILRIDSNIPTEYSSSRNIYFSSLGEKDAVVSLIKKIRKDIEYVEMAKMNDMFKHPIFIQD